MSNLATALRSSRKKTNGARLSRLIIDGGRLALQNVFDGIHPPATLQAILNTHYSTILRLLNKKIINKTQWNLLFPPSGNLPDSRNFDITLLFVLLRNICGLHPPTSGWDKKPVSTDTSREADLARIKWFRNEVHAHVTTTGIDAFLFSAHWIELSDTLVRLGLDRSEIDRLKIAPLDEDLYIQLLFKWKNEEEDIKEQLTTISAKLDALHHPNEVQIKGIKYCEKDLLGVGSQGRVYEGTFSGRRVAVKRMYKGPDEGNYVKDEAEKLKKLDHPNVVRCFEVEEEKEFVYLALEFCEKKLTDCVKQNDFHRKDSGLDGLTCLREITGAVAYLHERNICHRDINPDNILLSCSEQPRFVLADCNIAKNVHSASTVVGNPPGTLGYIAPELYEVEARITTKGDLFSLGCVFFYVISKGRHLFGPVKDLKKCQTNIRSAFRPPTLRDGDFSQENIWTKSLIARMLSYDPVQRPNATDVLEEFEKPVQTADPLISRSLIGNTVNLESKDYAVTQALNLQNYQKELAEDALQVSDIPDLKVLDDLSWKIVPYWNILGLRLGARQATIDNIMRDNLTYPTPQKKAFAVLISWHNKGSTSTFMQLAQALKYLGLDRLAEQLWSIGALRKTWKEGTPTIRELDNIAGNVVVCWEFLGIQLNVPASAMNNILCNNVNYSAPRQKAFQMLRVWRDKGRSSTYAQLGEALCNVGKESIAEAYCSDASL